MRNLSPNMLSMNPFRMIPNQNNIPSSRFIINGTIFYDKYSGIYTDQSGIYSFGPLNNNNNYNRGIGNMPPTFSLNPFSPFREPNNSFHFNLQQLEPHGPCPQYIPPSPYILNNTLFFQFFQINSIIIVSY